ncbi:hypothetical protein SMC59_003137 [Cronobacter sakazakii]|nr:hypothetical protein [Cronobacter sakazakii]
MSEIKFDKIQRLHDAATEFVRENRKMVLDASEVIRYLTAPPLALRERAEPVGEVALGSRDDEGNYPHAHVICLAGEGCADWDNFPDGFKLYTAPPAPVVPAAYEINADATDYHRGWNACRAAMLDAGAPVVPDELVSELLDIAKRAAEEADECANAEFSDNSMNHAREIAEWERRAAILQPVSQPYKLPASPQDESKPTKN